MWYSPFTRSNGCHTVSAAGKPRIYYVACSIRYWLGIYNKFCLGINKFSKTHRNQVIFCIYLPICFIRLLSNSSELVQNWHCCFVLSLYSNPHSKLHSSPLPDTWIPRRKLHEYHLLLRITKQHLLGQTYII